MATVAPQWSAVAESAAQKPVEVKGQGAVPFKPLLTKAAWTVADLRKTRAEWEYQLSGSEVAELEAAVAQVQATGKDIKDVTLADVSLPTLGPKLVEWRNEAVWGRGFQLIKGVPVWRWSRQQSVLAYWIVGLHWGKAVSNNKKGHLVGHIKDIGHDPANPNTRLYATNAPQPFHNDAADLVALLCLHNAREGGVSHFSSSIAVHNEILRRRPDLAPVLAGPWYFDRKGEVPAGKKPFFEIPAFNYHEGYLSVNWSSNYYIASQRHEEVPRLTPAHLEAIKLFDELAASDELRVDYVLQPGDIQLLSNHTVLHARGSFVDWEEPEKKRHLLRLWLAPAEDRPLPAAYAEILGGSVQIGNRGGIVVDGTVLHVPLEAE